ncbi:MAG: hypothetical protein ABL888_16130 [Pirellulaceae bacterium]
MGYNLYITRRHDWHDDAGPSITCDEWMALITDDPELSLKPESEGLYANWSGECTYPDPWFAYNERLGAIDTKNPDEPIIQKMLDIAEKLHARVQGDDGEIYTTPTEYHYQDEPNPSSSDKADTSVSWWRRLFGNG